MRRASLVWCVGRLGSPSGTAFQAVLRSCFSVALVSAVTSGILAGEASSEQEKAVALVKKLGGKVEIDDRRPD
jgi:hypothetical protein